MSIMIVFDFQMGFTVPQGTLENQNDSKGYNLDRVDFTKDRQFAFSSSSELLCPRIDTQILHESINSSFENLVRSVLD